MKKEDIIINNIIKSLIPRVLIALTFVTLIIVCNLGIEPALAFHLQAEANAIRQTKQIVQFSLSS